MASRPTLEERVMSRFEVMPNGCRKPLLTHCRNGHELTEENTRIGSDQGRIHRVCRTCSRAAVARYRERTSVKSGGRDV